MQLQHSNEVIRPNYDIYADIKSTVSPFHDLYVALGLSLESIIPVKDDDIDRYALILKKGTSDQKAYLKYLITRILNPDEQYTTIKDYVLWRNRDLRKHLRKEIQEMYKLINF